MSEGAGSSPADLPIANNYGENMPKTFVLKIPVSFQEEINLVPTGTITTTSMEMRVVVPDEATVEDVREAFALQFAGVVKLGGVVGVIDQPSSPSVGTSIKRSSKPFVPPSET